MWEHPLLVIGVRYMLTVSFLSPGDMIVTRWKLLWHGELEKLCRDLLDVWYFVVSRRRCHMYCCLYLVSFWFCSVRWNLRLTFKITCAFYAPAKFYDNARFCIFDCRTFRLHLHYGGSSSLKFKYKHRSKTNSRESAGVFLAKMYWRVNYTWLASYLCVPGNACTCLLYELSTWQIEMRVYIDYGWGVQPRYASWFGANTRCGRVFKAKI